MYTWEGMKKISKEEALVLFDAGHTEIYKLYEDDSESLMSDKSEFDEECEGYGIEISE